ncbi:hypothetical protein CWC24_11985 [Pseudoalteromonas ruthenica]|nr:hypothetical protein CWC24_11985 [Pseudoalteromonas ruthenica]TMO48495.1 hypothetical protein CWC23_17820 [Pseudoalteromonas ruthenica]
MLKAKILAVLLKLSDNEGNVDFKTTDLKQLWDIDGATEDRLWELNQVGAIYFEQIGEDGFAPIVICSTNEKTYEHLLNCLAQLSNDQNLLNERVTSLLNHDPKKLMGDILTTKNHIDEAKNQIGKNELLKPLQKPLSDIEQHFDSISRVAQNYDDVYKNILKPVQEEGKSGVRATVKWAIISIVASWALTNYSTIKAILSSFVS